MEKACKENGWPILEAFQAAADAAAEDMAKNPDAINNVAPGWLMWLHDCGFKCCNDTIGAVIRETVREEVHNADYTLKRRLYLIEAVIDMTDEDLQLFPYGNSVPEGAGNGGSRWIGEGTPDLYSWKRAGKSEKSFYNQFIGLATLLRSPHYCLAIDPQGHNYCRYTMMLPNWREIFADDYAAALAEEKAQQEAEQAAALQRETAAALAYSRDCAKIESWCKPLDGLPRNKQNAAAGLLRPCCAVVASLLRRSWFVPGSEPRAKPERRHSEGRAKARRPAWVAPSGRHSGTSTHGTQPKTNKKPIKNQSKTNQKPIKNQPKTSQKPRKRPTKNLFCAKTSSRPNPKTRGFVTFFTPKKQITGKNATH